jgi:hypothetical protein
MLAASARRGAAAIPRTGFRAGWITVKLHDSARLFARADGELLAADLHRSLGDQARDLAEAALERRRVAVRHLQVVRPSAGGAGNLMQG